MRKLLLFCATLLLLGCTPAPPQLPAQTPMPDALTTPAIFDGPASSPFFWEAPTPPAPAPESTPTPAVSTTPTTAPTPACTTAPLEPRLERMVNDISYFCQETRLAGSDWERAALDRAVITFYELGYKINEHPLKTEKFETRTVLATKKCGKDNAPLIILAAHADSVEVSPGATDNACGLAVLLEAARATATIEGGNVDVMFIAFAAEEWQAYGAREYVKILSPGEKGRIRGMLNLDMFASKNTQRVFAHFMDDELTMEFWLKLVEVANQKGINLVCDRPYPMISDATPFEEAGIPAILLTQLTVEDEYHTKHDTPDLISNDALIMALELATGWIDAEVRGE